MENKSLIFGKPYGDIKLISMGDDKNEPGVRGEDRETVKKDFFEKEVRKEKKYYFHGNMIQLENKKPVLALFRYKSKIIAYGRVMERIDVTDSRYIKKNDEYRDRYRGFLEIEDVFTVDDIDIHELNSALKIEIKNSQGHQCLNVDIDKFQALLFRKTRID